MEDQILKKLYKQLEENSNFGNFPLNIFLEETENLSESQFFIYSIEYNVHLKNIDKKHVNQVFGSRKHEVATYIESRLSATKSDYLSARYNHFLWVLTQNNQYCKKATHNYLLCLKEFRFSTDADKIFDFSDILEEVISIALKIKFQLDEIKKFIVSNLTSKQFPSKLKTLTIQQLVGHRLFKVEELEFIPELCVELANSETEYNWIKNNLDLALYFVLKFPKQKNLLLQINELLGDNELTRIKTHDGKPEHIIIPYQNQAIYQTVINYYKGANNIEKAEAVIKLFTENKKNLKYLTISNTVKRSKESIEMVNIHLENIIDSPEILIMLDICLGLRLLIVTNDLIEKSVNEAMEKYYYLKLFRPVQSDINSNNRKIDTFQFQKFKYYHTYINNLMQFIYNVVAGTIYNKKLSYSKLSKFLKNNTCFGKELIHFRGNDVEIKYTWFDQIDIALRSFFQQFTRQMTGKEVDWRIVIDILSLKFEGILRDIISLSGGVTTEIDREGNTSEITLEKLLNSPTFSKTFDEDDKNLFLYTFTKIGLNIRNYVAHSFYKKQDYTINKAILVFLCVLRLTKFNLEDVDK